MKNETKPARLDADRTAKPLTRIVQHVRPGDAVGPGRPLHEPEHEAEDGTRTPLVPKMTEEQIEAYERWARRMERC